MNNITIIRTVCIILFIMINDIKRTINDIKRTKEIKRLKERISELEKLTKGE